MLKEFGRIAREMLFLHGHLARPQDLEFAAPETAAAAGQEASPKPAKPDLSKLCLTAFAAGRVVAQIR